jgi:hypothetical protein
MSVDATPFGSRVGSVCSSEKDGVSPSLHPLPQSAHQAGVCTLAIVRALEQYCFLCSVPDSPVSAPVSLVDFSC